MLPTGNPKGRFGYCRLSPLNVQNLQLELGQYGMLWFPEESCFSSFKTEYIH